jgi:hypothetical protein
VVEQLEAVDPYTTEFSLWADDLCSQLSSYNAPLPGPEAAWVSWAERICSLPPFESIGVPTPSEFSSWRDWGAALLQVAA